MTIDITRLAKPINRRSPVPLYHQVAERLRALIAAGDVAAGERLPNEIELAEAFALSRPTMRQALDELVRDGLITRRRGVGTVVTHQQFRRGTRLNSVFDDLVAAGREPTTKVISARLEHGPEDVAATYGLPAGGQVMALERLRSADGEPLVLMRNWLPASYSFLADTDLSGTGLYHVMRERGDVPATAQKSISACAAPKRVAELLGVRRGAPLLRVRHVGLDVDEHVLDVGDHLYRSDTHAIDVVET